MLDPFLSNRIFSCPLNSTLSVDIDIYIRGLLCFVSFTTVARQGTRVMKHPYITCLVLELFFS